VVGARCRYVGKKPWSHLMAYGAATMRQVSRKSVGVSRKSVGAFSLGSSRQAECRHGRA
jgi:hypothetical protein